MRFPELGLADFVSDTSKGPPCNQISTINTTSAAEKSTASHVQQASSEDGCPVSQPPMTNPPGADTRDSGDGKRAVENSFQHLPQDPQTHREATPIPLPRIDSTDAPERRSRRHTPRSNPEPIGTPKRASVNQAYRVRKPPTPNRQSVRNSTVASFSVTPAPTGQPSEADLFYMLIHKLKRRDDAEAASVAMREQMEEKLRKAGDENKALTAQLNQAMIRYKKQGAEMTSQRGLIERWKVKFGKLRGVVKGIGDDQESIRDEGQRLKSTQSSLFQEKSQFFEQVKVISNATETVGQKLSNQRRQVSEIRHAAADLDHLVVRLKTQLADREISLVRERNHAARLEGHIENASKGHLRIAKEIRKDQIGTLSKIERIYKHIDASSKDHLETFRADLRPLLETSTEMLNIAKETEIVDPAQLRLVESLIRNLDHQ